MPLAALVGLGLAVGCQQGTTEILVVVDTDLAIPGDIDIIRAEITDPAGEVRTSDARFGVDEAPLPRTLGMIHEGGPLGPYDVVVRGLLGDVEVVSRSARVSFVTGEIRVLRMFLLRDCVGEMCGAGMTCGEIGCRPVAVPPDELTPWTGEVPRLGERDAGPPGDDGGMDASVDGGIDAGMDGGMDGGIDAGGGCPAVCNGGCDVPGRCLIIGAADSPALRCPDGLRCRVECTTAGSCPERIHCAEDGSACVIECSGAGSCASSSDCESALACSINCTGSMSCAGNNDCKDAAMCTILCGAPDSCAGAQQCRAAGPCSVTCSGDRACAGLGTCETAACTHSCSGADSCALGVSCMTSCACSVDCSAGACVVPPVCPTGCDDAQGCRGSGGCNTCP